MNSNIEVRNLKAQDLFIVSTIVSKLGIREIKNCFQNDELKELVKGVAGKEDDVNLEAIGISVAFDIAGLLLANLKDCEQEIYKLLSNLTGLKINELKDLDGANFVDLIIQVITNPSNKDFFDLASRFRNLKK